MTSDSAKQALRQRALEARRKAVRDGVADLVCARFQAALEVSPGTVVGGYWPIGEEMDVRPLLHVLHDQGAICALPVVVVRNAALVFRRWRPGLALEKGDHGTSVPPAGEDELMPSLILTPLLAFDRTGHRLGYGGGYYDRTFEALRAAGAVTAVGIGYAAQELTLLPYGGHDQRLDWVVTEKAAICMAKRPSTARRRRRKTQKRPL